MHGVVHGEQLVGAGVVEALGERRRAAGRIDVVQQGRVIAVVNPDLACRRLVVLAIVSGELPIVNVVLVVDPLGIDAGTALFVDAERRNGAAIGTRVHI